MVSQLSESFAQTAGAQIGVRGATAAGTNASARHSPPNRRSSVRHSRQTRTAERHPCQLNEAHPQETFSRSARERRRPFSYSQASLAGLALVLPGLGQASERASTHRRNRLEGHGSTRFVNSETRGVACRPLVLNLRS